MSTVSVRYIVTDVDTAIAFYTERLGFDLDIHPAPGFARLSRGALRLLLNRPGAGGAGQAVPDRFVDMLALAGTPDEVREQVQRVLTVPEVTRIILLPQNPGQGFIERESILRTFAEQVMARLG